MATDVYVLDDIVKETREVIVALDDVIKNRRGLVLSDALLTGMQAAMRVKLHGQLGQKIYEIALSSAISAERSSPGAFFSCLEKIRSGLDQSKIADDDIRRQLSSGVFPAQRHHVDKIIEESMALVPRRVKEMLNSALDMSGFSGRIVVEKTVSSTPSVELVRGYTFNIQPAIAVTALLDKPRIIVIDGYIESVAEIHGILQAANETLEHCLLFIRGTHPDVLTTLKTNFDRGTLRIIPVIVPLELKGINTLKDIAVVSGGDVISNLKGELITNIKFAEQPRIDSASVLSDRVILISTSTTRGISAHVNDLRKRAEEIVDDRASLYNARIRSLSPNHVIIRLPDDMEYVASAQAIDYVLRGIKSLAEKGVLADESSAAATYSAATQARHCLRTLKDLGAAVITS